MSRTSATAFGLPRRKSTRTSVSTRTGFATASQPLSQERRSALKSGKSVRSFHIPAASLRTASRRAPLLRSRKRSTASRMSSDCFFPVALAIEARPSRSSSVRYICVLTITHPRYIHCHYTSYPRTGTIGTDGGLARYSGGYVHRGIGNQSHHTSARQRFVPCWSEGSW